MTELHQIYTCPVCGNRIEIIHPGAGELVCCGQAMKLEKAGTSDGAAEKHVPVIEKVSGGYHVKVGSVEHPSTEAHYIEWIALKTKFGNQRKALKPGDAPEAVFCICEGDEVEAVYEYCNLHSLWKA